MLGKVYYATGWFNPASDEEEKRVKAKLRQLGFDVFSPREYFDLPPDADDKVRQDIFDTNCKQIYSCDIFFGITDYKDMGTLTECGMVSGINMLDSRKRKIVYYCETLPEGASFNVMLAQAADVVVTKFEDLDKLPEWLETGHKYEGAIR